MSAMKVWMPIVGFEGLYEVSILGKVRSLTYPTKKGRMPRKVPLIIGQSIKRGTHLSVSLKNLAGKYKTLYVHSIMAEAFIGPRPEGMLCCHDDGDELNNVIGNLRWDTAVENQKDRVKHGTDVRGSKHPRAKLSDEQALEIKRRRIAGEKGVDLAKEFNVSVALVALLHKNKVRTWLEL